MKMMLGIFLLMTLTTTFGWDSPKVKPAEMKPLIGAKWKGELIYLDYGSNKKVSIQSNLTVTQSIEDNSAWVFDYEYPLEPKANKKVTVKLSKDGKTFDDGLIIEKVKLPNNTLKIVTTENGADNDKKAVFHHTYLINSQSFSVRKDVKYEGTNDFFERNEYSWKR